MSTIGSGRSGRAADGRYHAQLADAAVRMFNVVNIRDATGAFAVRGGYPDQAYLDH